MFKPIPEKIRSLSLILAMVCCTPHTVAETAPGAEVNDLAYGVSLYHFFQDKYFSAITELLVANERASIKQQGSDPQLLLGGLYLSYGLDNQASTIFGELTDSISPVISDRAWFNLGKLQYKRDSITQAEAALNRVADTLPAHRKSERLHLLSNIYLQQKQPDKAGELLASTPDGSVWKSYAQFNLGIALIKQGKQQEGISLLSNVAEISPGDHETAALRDKANLAIGFSLMKTRTPEQAATAFSKVRLDGPQSNSALLGVGWAWNQQSLHEKALVPWLELKSRNPLDPAVQESLLAIPYSFENLNKPRLALTHYDIAASTYERQLRKLEQTTAAIKKGELLKALKPGNLGDESSFSLFRSQLPPSISAPYLQTMIASHSFQEAIKNYQDLLYLEYVLERWNSSLPTFTLMLNERRDLYQTKSPELVQNDRLNKIDQLTQQRNMLATEIERIIRTDDILTLANEDESEQLQLLGDVKTRLNTLSSHENLSEQQDKHILLQGILYWKISDDAVPRQWQLKKALKELDNALTDTKNTDSSLRKTWKAAPDSFKGYADRINGKDKLIVKLQKKNKQLKHAQEQRINLLAINAISHHKQRLEKYLARARFSLARLFDSLERTENP